MQTMPLPRDVRGDAWPTALVGLYKLNQLNHSLKGPGFNA
jgi:hypothetical protein